MKTSTHESNSEFFDFGVHLPSRTILFELTKSDDKDGQDELGYNSYTQFIKGLHLLEYENFSPITVLLNCPGGDLEYGFGIFDAIKKCPCHVRIDVFGQAASMGAVILQAGDERRMYPHSKLMLHDIRASVSDRLKDAQREMEMVKIQQEQMYEIFAQVSKQGKNYWRRKMKDDYHLLPDQALKEGLIDKIVKNN